MWPFIKLLPEKTNFAYVKFAPFLGLLSALACIASLYLTIFPLVPPCGGLNCGVDFKGGTVIEFTTSPRPVDLGAIREPLNNLGLGEVQLQGFTDPTVAMVRYETPEGSDPVQTSTRVQEAISAALGEVEFGRRDVVGPKVSGELFLLGVIALLAGIGLMLCYIWFRFGFTFGAAAVIALGHDVILTFGLFAVTQLDFSLTAVGSILTIIGYSINDKIVVLDRVRENLRKYKKMPMKELIDLSVNETLSRTIITGVTGLMALTVMAYFGGDALFSFAVSMIFGIVVGTYSSIYIAAPALIYLGVGKRENFKETGGKKPSARSAEALR
ncbi:protein-export membrane protein SecF [alpha proteobacterium U9-1i]|nr:protein-export membrane protein SecF [alpha proteobacterium U9-1i]